MSLLPQDKLNILLVIARPYGEKDIALKTIARPLLDSVAQIRKKVNIKVLRPPSFEEFERELNGNKGFYKFCLTFGYEHISVCQDNNCGSKNKQMIRECDRYFRNNNTKLRSVVVVCD